MKTLTRIFLTGAFLGTAACGSNQGASTTSATTAAASASPLTTTTSTTGSSTVLLQNVSTYEMDQFFYATDPVAPQNARITVDLSEQGNSTYAGQITINYEDASNVTHTAIVSSNHPYTNVSDSSLNVWHDFDGTGTQLFHGIFQDAYGAVVLVIDSVSSSGLGDGTGTGLLSGSIWFQNFGQTNAVQGPNSMCWQIQVGPFDCRTFLVGSTYYANAVVNTYSSLYPTTSTTGGDSTATWNGNRPAFAKLGDFTGLSQTQAFNQ
jgi:hypothetical protein